MMMFSSSERFMISEARSLTESASRLWSREVRTVEKMS